jgi:hypothetical protein
MPDFVNGMFEFLGGMFIIANILKLWRDKSVKGVWPPAVAFFTTWGFWNLYYYPSLGQWFSTICGAIIAFFNTIWVILLFYYQRKEKQCG